MAADIGANKRQIEAKHYLSWADKNAIMPNDPPLSHTAQPADPRQRMRHRSIAAQTVGRDQ